MKSRMLYSNQGYGWHSGGTGSQHMPQPPMPPFPGGGEPGYGYPTPPPGDGTLYPNIGFNPALLNPSPSETMTRYMECPMENCSRILSPPIYQCEQGHAICNICIDRLDYCMQPQCMEPLEGPKIRNIALEQRFYQGLPEIRCPNEGCSMVLNSREHLDAHLHICGFRGFPFCSKYLGFDNCSERFTKSTLLSHLNECHQVKTSEQNQLVLKLVAGSHHFNSTSYVPHQQQGIVWSPLVITLNNEDDEQHQILVKCFISPSGILSLSGYLLLSTSHDHSDWKIKCQINSPSKVARLEWTGCLIHHPWNESMAASSSSKLAVNLNTFRIPVSLLQEYIQQTNALGEDQSSSKINIRVCVWNKTMTMPVWVSESSQDEDAELLHKVTLFSKIPGQDENAFSLTVDETDHPWRETASSGEYQYGEEEYTNYYSVDSSCSHCNRPLYGNVIYQCLQCPSENQATYFCRNCIERANIHGEHLTVRISKPALQPLAAVAFECSVGELH